MAEAQIKITADTSQAQQSLKNLDASLESLGKSTATAAKFFAGLTAAAAGIAFTIKQTLDGAGELVDASNRLGVSAANLNQLSQAARLAGIDTGTLNVTIQRLNRSIGEGIQKSTAPAAVALKNLGLPISELARLKPDEQFTRIAETLSKIENPAQRTAMSMELLGKQGPAVLQLANELEKVREITELGFGVSEGELVALDEAGDAIEQLGIMWDAGIKKAVAELAPYIVGFVVNLKDAIREAGGWEAVFNRIKEIAHTIANVIAIMATIITTRLVIGTAAVAVNMARAAIAARSFSLFLSRTPIGLLTAGVALLADKIGIDLVGGSEDLNDTQSIYAKGTAEINKSLETRNQNLKASHAITKTINDEQTKIKTNLTETIAKYEAEANAIKLTSQGKGAQANLEKIIGEEKAKYAKVELAMTPLEEKKLTNAVKRVELAKAEAVVQGAIRDQLYARANIEASLGANSLADARINQAVLKVKQELAKLGQKLDPIEENKIRRNELGLIYAEKEVASRTKLLNLMQQYGLNTIDAPAIDVKAYDLLANAMGNGHVQVKNLLKDLYGLEEAYKKVVAEFEKENKTQLDILNMDEFKDNAFLLELTNQAHKDRMADIDKRYAQARLQIEHDANKKAAEMVTQNQILQIEAANREVLIAQDRATRLIAIQEQVRRAQLMASGITNQGIIEGQVAVGRAIDSMGQTQIGQARGALNVATTVLGEFGKTSKSAFEAYKKLAIAQALIDTAKSVSAALSGGWMAGGPLGPFTSAIYAAMALASGMAQVAAIRSQTYAGRALGGPMVGGQSYLVGERGPEIFTPGNAGSMTPNNQIAGGATNITFNIVANDTKGFDQLLVERRPLITKIIADAQLERGRRQI
jgi:hypothetical protein